VVQGISVELGQKISSQHWLKICYATGSRHR